MNFSASARTSRFELVCAHTRLADLMVIEGNYGVGKSSLASLLAKVCGSSVSASSQVLPTAFLDDAVLGQAIYVLHDAIKYRRAVAERRSGGATILERYLLSTLAHHYAADEGRLSEVELLIAEMLKLGLLSVANLVVVVEARLDTVIEVNQARGWNLSERYLGRLNEFYRELPTYAFGLGLQAELLFIDRSDIPALEGDLDQD